MISVGVCLFSVRFAIPLIKSLICVVRFSGRRLFFLFSNEVCVAPNCVWKCLRSLTCMFSFNRIQRIWFVCHPQFRNCSRFLHCSGVMVRSFLLSAFVDQAIATDEETNLLPRVGNYLMSSCATAAMHKAPLAQPLPEPIRTSSF